MHGPVYNYSIFNQKVFPDILDTVVFALNGENGSGSISARRGTSGGSSIISLNLQ